MNRGPVTEEREASPAGTESPQASTESQCVHHWIIETPSGATSRGVCKICGAERVFQNYVTDFPWEDDPLDSLPQGGWRKPVTELVRPSADDRDDSSFAAASGTTGDALFF